MSDYRILGGGTVGPVINVERGFNRAMNRMVLRSIAKAAARDFWERIAATPASQIRG